MKCILFLLISFYSFSQTTISNEKKTQDLIQIWGLLKYMHPEISKGKNDFDKEFIKQFYKIQSINTQEKLNIEFINWIASFETKKTIYTTNKKLLKSKKLFTKNADFTWIENSNFSPNLVQLLNKVKNNGSYGKYYAKINSLASMVSFPNDNGYDDFDAKETSNRMLFLASFWNTMRYWNVNIYLTEIPWETVLTEIIPEFFSNDAITYELAKDKLFSKLNDSHSNYNSSYLFKDVSIKKSLYGGRVINDTLVITTVFNKELSDKEGIELGDLIYKIDNKKISEYYKENFSNRISASNENHLKSFLEYYFLLSAKAETLTVEVLKKDKSSKRIEIKLYQNEDYKYEPVNLGINTVENFKTINDSIGYINLRKITKKELKIAFKTFETKKGIIIDLRNYPKNLSQSDVPKNLLPKGKQFMKALVPLAPSFAEYNIKAKLRLIYNPFSAGKKNKNYYKGKVVLLVDRSTGSMAEYFAMAIQQAPNCITIGEQTFGAVMNRNEVILSDKTTVDFTGMGAFYPNDLEVQRNGIKLDYKVVESALNYNSNKYFEEAIKLINKY
jgi:C-terminal processing protease CtpA/Prc